ncbi:extracellular solute-binding protein [Rarobacter faecitabidus]|uniref:Probable sugar-binding periplasmic protein n=1 Tax=Rarobacter faecitabidus TaxID=13243 RepID=A0A542ZXB3_RARFA|nr:ABC transporter substrate-binding protein [Rarobacter faecitabidus]TQL64994.1 carbohydrate ABC transporter substrate-binding protein (CUT1 family) [Rarobacter faecitabidus]
MRLKVIRTIALASALAITAGLTGCSSGGDGAVQAELSKTEAEVFTWWADGSEKAGLDALVGVMAQQAPNVTFVNAAVAGGAGTNAREVLAERLAIFDPPDSFQLHAGAEAADYVKDGQLRDLTSLYEELGLQEAFPQSLLDSMKVNDKIYSIPANIHRANVVWVNPEVLKAAGIDPKEKFKTTRDWIEALRKIRKIGKTPLAIGQSWTQLQVFETTLLADLGADKYSGLWNGKTSWTSAEVGSAIDNFRTLMSLTNENRNDLEWQQALGMVQDGSAGFNIMGDWAAAELEGQGVTLGTDILYYPVPGTEGDFDFLADAFTLPVGAPNPDGAKAWLTAVASPAGQIAFNKAKGSIPARTDVDTSTFSEYQQGALKDFSENTIVASLAHGAAASPTASGIITTALGDFLASRIDQAEFQSTVAAAFK